MKRFSKIFVTALAVLMLISTISFAGCKKTTSYEVKCEVLGAKYTMQINFYDNYVPKASKKIIEYLNGGLYNDVVFYKLSDYSNQIMFGDYKFDSDGNVVQNEIMPMFEAEIENYNVTYKNKDKADDFPLLNVKGAVGIWRTWCAGDSANTYKTANSMNTNRNTLYIPTESIYNYNENFCIFASLDLEDSDTSTALQSIISLFENKSNYTEYTVFYTGEYDEKKPNENFGLKFNCLTTEAYNDLSKKTEGNVTTINFSEDSKETLFVAKGGEYVEYNLHKILVPKNTKILSVKAK